ncbi:hypothetical protein [Stenotrophomonas panacihumi]|uniref:hypothetical protein n=1 Tax=Stenotrophomonas panacihumi TaxID=676599 RepID=UPI000A4BC9F4|nr:hypothetical protein [Stenotrophomonas panacihumi]
MERRLAGSHHVVATCEERRGAIGRRMVLGGYARNNDETACVCDFVGRVTLEVDFSHAVHAHASIPLTSRVRPPVCTTLRGAAPSPLDKMRQNC